MRNKKGISLISLGIMMFLIIILAVMITMLFLVALKNNVDKLQQTSSDLEQII